LNENRQKRKEAAAVLDEGEPGAGPRTALSAARRHIDQFLVRGVPNGVVHGEPVATAKAAQLPRGTGTSKVRLFQPVFGFVDDSVGVTPA
jgi:hypothetical protein